MEDPTHLPVVLDLVATGAGAFTGGLLALRWKLPTGAVLAIAVANGFGGGLLRDVLLGRTPPAALQHGRYVLCAVLCAVLCGLVCVVTSNWVHLARRVILGVDAVGGALFATVGASIALAVGLEPLPAILIGCLNGIGGGLLRDLLAGVRPDLSVGGPITTSAAIATAIAFVVLVRGIDLATTPAQVISVALGTGLRIGAEWKGLAVPEPTHLPDRLRTASQRYRASGAGRTAGRGERWVQRPGRYRPLGRSGSPPWRRGRSEVPPDRSGADGDRSDAQDADDQDADRRPGEGPEPPADRG